MFVCDNILDLPCYNGDGGNLGVFKEFLIGGDAHWWFQKIWNRGVIDEEFQSIFTLEFFKKIKYYKLLRFFL